MDQLNSNFNQLQQHGSGRSFTPNSGSLPSMTSVEGLELCLVCNDVSTGYHYGCPSCNGCKTFFRRTIMKKQTFKCQYNENCPVDKSVRCACRHCRFRKCLAAGMKPDGTRRDNIGCAIQQNRDPIGYTKRTRRYPMVKSGTITPSSSFKSGACGVDDEAVEHKYADVMMGVASGGVGGAAARDQQLSQQLSPQHSVVELSPEQVAEDALMRSLMEVERRIATLRNSQMKLEKSLVDMVMQPSVFYDGDFMRRQAESSVHSVGVLRRAQHEDYQYWHHRDWLIMIEWAKTIPVYQRLPLNDKLALLRHSAITHPSLLQCFYTPDCGPDTIVFPNGAFFDRTIEQDRPSGFQRKKFKMLDNLLGPMRKMQIDANEFAATKAIFFLNPDSDDLSMEVRGPINECRAAIINALYRYMVEKHGRVAAVDRFGKLLLLGTVIATLAVEAKEAVVVADFFEQIHFTSFAKQLLFGVSGTES